MVKQENKAQQMQEVEVMIGQILRIGVGISLFVIICGMLLGMINGGSGYAKDVWPLTLPDILTGVWQLKSYAWLMLGLLLLILTPVLRVVASIFSFMKEGDRRYVWITTLVLFILILSALVGHFK